MGEVQTLALTLSLQRIALLGANTARCVTGTSSGWRPIEGGGAFVAGRRDYAGVQSRYLGFRVVLLELVDDPHILVKQLVLLRNFLVGL